MKIFCLGVSDVKILGIVHADDDDNDRGRQTAESKIWHNLTWLICTRLAKKEGIMWMMIFWIKIKIKNMSALNKVIFFSNCWWRLCTKSIGNVQTDIQVLGAQFYNHCFRFWANEKSRDYCIVAYVDNDFFPWMFLGKFTTVPLVYCICARLCQYLDHTRIAFAYKLIWYDHTRILLFLYCIVLFICVFLCPECICFYMYCIPVM